VNDRELIEAARQLAFDEPTGEQVEEMRTVVLASMPSRAPARLIRRRWPLAIGAIAAAAATLLTFARPRDHAHPPRPMYNATVTAVGPATFARVRAAGDEIIRLTEGLVHVDVEPLESNERCRVIVGDGEVEVRGTSFEVEAHRDRLARVRVAHGRVEVRSHGVVTILAAGQTWTPSHEAPTITQVTAAPSGPAPTVVAVPKDATRPSRHATTSTVQSPTLEAPQLSAEAAVLPPAVSPPTTTRAENEFRRGWAALRANKPAEAAESFDRVVALAPPGGIAEDAAFWRAVAFLRAGSTARAANEFAAFLEQFPSSVRSGEACVLLGRLLLDAGDVEGAEKQFERASTDATARVRTGGEAGLSEIKHRRMSRR
jgi:TolA-binding protein